ncbi:hypothetical protein JCGZ_17206 [Jatropha curcas]|uniref:Uncharacterized protein n=2 Tax=Jatropha curcas TaxID=180498 RepID=A0A067LMG2_JATCU|nr:hypothetical protein JCGZ_17206 [Jatropha curcas]
MTEKEEEPLSPWSSAFVKSESGVYVIAILGFKNRINPSFFKDNLMHTLMRNPRFSSLQVIDDKDGKVKWIRTSVNVEDHVIVPQLNQEMGLSPHAFLEDYISNLSKTNLDISKPLWDFHILNLKTDDAESVCILRVHHALGDGFSLISLLLSSTHKVSDPEAFPSFPMKKKKEKYEEQNNLSYFAKCWLIFRFYWNSMVDVIMLIATLFFFKDSKTPITNSTCRGSFGRRIVYKIFSLDDIKLVKNATNTTVNDVITAVLQASLSRYLNRLYGDNNRATEENNNLPKRLNVRAAVPVALDLGLNALRDRVEQNSNMGSNNFGFVFIPLRIAIKDDPLDYVRSAKAAMDRKKNSLEAIASATILKLLIYFFGIKGASFMARKIPSQTTMLLSNLPGPTEEIAWYGHPISFIAPTVYGAPKALTMHFQSYFNKMAIVLSVDESAIPNPHQLCTDFEESLKLIKDAAIARANNSDGAIN